MLLQILFLAVLYALSAFDAIFLYPYFFGLNFCTYFVLVLADPSSCWTDIPKSLGTHYSVCCLYSIQRFWESPVCPG